jgi:hypothetical protein
MCGPALPESATLPTAAGTPITHRAGDRRDVLAEAEAKVISAPLQMMASAARFFCNHTITAAKFTALGYSVCCSIQAR